MFQLIGLPYLIRLTACHLRPTLGNIDFQMTPKTLSQFTSLGILFFKALDWYSYKLDFLPLILSIIRLFLCLLTKLKNLHVSQRKSIVTMSCRGPESIRVHEWTHDPWHCEDEEKVKISYQPEKYTPPWLNNATSK